MGQAPKWPKNQSCSNPVWLSFKKDRRGRGQHFPTPRSHPNKGVVFYLNWSSWNGLGLNSQGPEYHPIDSQARHPCISYTCCNDGLRLISGHRRRPRTDLRQIGQWHSHTHLQMHAWLPCYSQFPHLTHSNCIPSLPKSMKTARVPTRRALRAASEQSVQALSASASSSIIWTMNKRALPPSCFRCWTRIRAAPWTCEALLR